MPVKKDGVTFCKESYTHTPWGCQVIAKTSRCLVEARGSTTGQMHRGRACWSFSGAAAGRAHRRQH